MSNPEYRDQDHIKSYVKRAHRMSGHQRNAYERLRDVYCVPAKDYGVDPRTLFSRTDSPVVLEIGFGMGRATAELAAAEPARNFLGVEVYTPGVGKLLSLIEENNLDNVRIVHGDAITVLERMIPGRSLDAIHLFFPDPWPKKRHHKRRFVRPALTELMASRLKVGAYLYMVTDWREYAEKALEILEATRGLSNAYEDFASPQRWRPSTAFEAKGRENGRPISELYFTAT